MEVTPQRLLMACLVMFGGMVAIGIVTQSAGNEEFKASLSKIDLSSLRSRLQREEGISAPQPVVEDVAEEAESTEE